MRNLKQIERQFQKREPGILGASEAMQSAVIVPLVFNERNELSILFEVRSKKLNKQPGEICFPGGKIDPDDKSAEAAAIRELTEEIGVKDEIEIIAPLDVLVTPFRGIIYPFLGKIKDLDNLAINKNEVDHIFTVPLSFFENYQPQKHLMRMNMQPGDDFPFKKIANNESYSARHFDLYESFYYFEDYVIWGLTAKILTHFLEAVKG
ncbi:NUDIX hydrolase [Halalkalibacter krulwichiae]|uniref:Putative NUDIX hydrolase n=1 Tax=Halalkalibacter krulwichiae TaxID=199441 RepID=A0A1X9M762_9BACI|nr:CoA pyrophosphatase [Halalkalibacter krulwichiae]ARK29258.1 putative NUDIX hydrolase [Halalkalibacter krulwichiae]